MTVLAEPDRCGGCERVATDASPVTWSPAFESYLCTYCRIRRTDAELGATERANAAARVEQRMKASLAFRMRSGSRR